MKWMLRKQFCLLLSWWILYRFESFSVMRDVTKMVSCPTANMRLKQKGRGSFSFFLFFHLLLVLKLSWVTLNSLSASAAETLPLIAWRRFCSFQNHHHYATTSVKKKVFLCVLLRKVFRFLDARFASRLGKSWCVIGFNVTQATSVLNVWHRTAIDHLSAGFTSSQAE